MRTLNFIESLLVLVVAMVITSCEKNDTSDVDLKVQCKSVFLRETEINSEITKLKSEI